MKTTEVTKLLKRARKRISKYESWHRGNFYVIKGEGRSYLLDGPKPEAYCALGALRCEYGDGSRRPAAEVRAQNALTQALPKKTLRTVVTYNDSRRGRRGHQQILRLFDRAIAISENKWP